jgi:hypothetical protein
MKDGFFLRVSIDKETRIARIERLIETSIDTTSWHEGDVCEGIDPENFDYTTIGNARRVLKNDTGPYQYYWVTIDMAAWEDTELTEVEEHTQETSQ